MDVADMDFYLMQAVIEDFIYIYDNQIKELANCISEIKNLEAGILKSHWSGEGRDSFTAKIKEWASDFESCKTMMKIAKKAASRLDDDADILVRLVDTIKIT